ncbi:PucR family transcriptional regulator [Bacillus sp. H-16]|uniref:PucR family transcriptional regulator n=1 Tax=Alteribacter salitolerans TaxID=2912333 RepID=UPI001964D237|nr:helix-turn-helix domain-containing protein [Alteribacter salitolerans]MBM7096180.1 PucR family transcriptional regulator [Alteribacter salitolerans]
MSTKSTHPNPFKGSFGSLENLVDKISDVLECPVTIEDPAHRLLAYSSHGEGTDSARIATIMRRRVPERVISSLWKDGTMQRLHQSEKPVRISQIQEVGLGDRIAMTIRSKTEIIGYIWLLEVDNQLDDDDLELLSYASQAAKNQLVQLHGRKKKREKGHQEFFWQLLTGHLKNHDEISESFEGFNIKVTLPVAVFVFQFPEEINDKTERNISYMITTTQKIIAPLYALDGNELVLLGSPSSVTNGILSPEAFIEEFTSQMALRFHSGNLIGGSGNGYTDYTKIETSYQEALSVLKLKEQFSDELRGTCTYNHLGIYRYIDVLSAKNKEDGYENLSLKKLKEYDLLHNTQLKETLDVFLIKDSHVNEAAKALNVHSNTLNYRLKRITEVGGINLRDPNEKMTLFLDMKLDKLKQNGLL